MTSILQKTAMRVGYDNPSQLFRKTAWMSVTFALATVAGKFFVLDLNIRSHFAFGQWMSLVFNLIFYNDHIGRKIIECPNAMQQDIFFMIHHIAFAVIPIGVGKVIVSRWFSNISWIQAIKRGVYFGSVGMATFCVTQAAKKEQRPLEF